MIILLAKVKERPNLCHMLQEHLIHDAWDLSLALFHHDEAENRDVGTDDAAHTDLRLGLPVRREW